MEKKGLGIKLVVTAIIALIVGFGLGFTLRPIIIPPPVLIREVRIGSIYPMSGPPAKYGRDARRMFDLALEEINKEGIKSLGGAKITLIWADNQGKADVERVEAERLITVEKVSLVIGSCYSSLTLVGSEVSERYEVPWVTGVAAATPLTRRGFEWFFRTNPHDEMFVKGAFKFLKDLQAKTGVKLKTMALLYDNTLFGVSYADSARLWNGDPEIGGYEIVLDIAYESPTADVSSEVLKLKEANPDILLLSPILPADAILISETFQRLDFNCKVIVANDAGATHPDYFAAVGTLADYICSRAAWAPDVKKERSLDINRRFRELYGTNMDEVMARYYDLIWTAYWALEKAGSTDPVKIREALLELELSADQVICPWKGVKFAPPGDPDAGQNLLADAVITMNFNGTFYTVWPWDVASMEIVFPMPTWEERG